MSAWNELVDGKFHYKVAPLSLSKQAVDHSRLQIMIKRIQRMNKKPKVQVHRTPPTPSAPNSVLGRLNSQMLSTNITMGNPSMQVIGICINLDRKQQGKKETSAWKFSWYHFLSVRQLWLVFGIKLSFNSINN